MYMMLSDKTFIISGSDFSIIELSS
ncbi:hypothetical protein RDI58_010158 [Solanum bulbocastanum]|uniref:Uncharacterized protein n=1 Tax=Solanum bulbocastanum TaxID=147425 RepID=A0AAN8TTG9_SOLBU